MSAGLSTTMLRTEAATKPIACATSPSPRKAITSPTSAPSEKKSKKKETERSSPAKATAASTAQKMMSRFSKLRLLDQILYQPRQDGCCSRRRRTGVDDGCEAGRSGLFSGSQGRQQRLELFAALAAYLEVFLNQRHGLGGVEAGELHLYEAVYLLEALVAADLLFPGLGYLTHRRFKDVSVEQFARSFCPM